MARGDVARDVVCDVCLQVGAWFLQEKIEKDEMRVSMPGRHNGISVNRYLHPACFAERCVGIDFAPTSRGKCSGDGRAIGKGEMRLTMTLRNCEGKAQTTKLWHPPNAAPFLSQLFAACDGASSSVSIGGLSPATSRRPTTARGRRMRCVAST